MYNGRNFLENSRKMYPLSMTNTIRTLNDGYIYIYIYIDIIHSRFLSGISSAFVGFLSDQPIVSRHHFLSAM